MKKKSVYQSDQKNFVARVFNAIAENNAIRLDYGRFYRAQIRVKVFEETLFNEYDLRGLSKAEKEFIRENGMKSYYDCRDILGKMHRYYIFINKDKATDKKHIYAYDKMQWLKPNGKDIGDYWNYAYWLTIDTKRGEISKYNYEYRFSNMLSFMWPFG